MSKGRQLTKKKWKNGQRQKGAGKSPYAGDKGHHAPPWSSIKYPRGSKFLKCFDGKHLAMKMAMRIRKLNWLWW